MDSAWSTHSRDAAPNSSRWGRTGHIVNAFNRFGETLSTPDSAKNESGSRATPTREEVCAEGISICNNRFLRIILADSSIFDEHIFELQETKRTLRVHPSFASSIRCSLSRKLFNFHFALRPPPNPPLTEHSPVPNNHPRGRKNRCKS